MKITTLLFVILLSAVTSIGLFYLVNEFNLLSKDQKTEKVDKKVTLDNSLLDALILVDGKGGRGSGFFAKMDGKKYLFSNIHVIMGSSDISFTDRNGKKYKPVKAAAAEDRDIVRIEMAETPTQVFNIISPQAIDVPIVISGNPLGLEVIKNVHGNLVGIGPKRVETDAKFVSGNSGSPLIDKNNDVVGIATFTVELDEESKDTNSFTKIRRFGYRIANVKKWLPVDPKKFMLQGKIIKRRKYQLKALKTVLSYWWYNPFWSEIPYESTLTGNLRKWVHDHNYHLEQHRSRLKAANEYGVTKGEEVQINRQMQQHLKNEANVLISALDRFMTVSVEKWHIPFFSKQWEEQKRMAAFLKEKIIRTRNSNLNANSVYRYNLDDDVDY